MKKWETPPKVEPQIEITTCVSVPAWLLDMLGIEDEPQIEEWYTYQDEQEYDARHGKE